MRRRLRQTRHRIASIAAARASKFVRARAQHLLIAAVSLGSLLVMPSLDAVPDDVVLEIAAHVAEPDNRVSAALAPLSLVCRALHRPVRMAMLATVEVTQRTRIGGLVCLLQAQPEFASHVQRIEVIRYGGVALEEVALQTDVEALGRLAVEVRTLVVHTENETGLAILRAVGDNAHGLEELNYSEFTRGNPSGEAAVVVIQQQARSLRRINYLSGIIAGAPDVPISLPRLTYLSFGRHHGEDTLAWLLDEVPRLGRLAISGDDVHSVPDALAVRLRKLDIAVPIPTSRFQMAWLARFKQLASLTVTNDSDALEEDELMAIPATVEHLQFTGQDDDQVDGIGVVLADASWLPALKSVAICTWRKRDASMPFGELRAVAAGRGVKIEVNYLR